MQQRMEDHQVDGFLVTQNVDLYYLCGSMQQGYLFVPLEGEAIFYVRRSYSRALSECWCQTKPLGSFRDFGRLLQEDFPNVFQHQRAKAGPTIALEYDVLPVQQQRRLERVLPGVDWTDGAMLLRQLRMIKDAVEIDRMKKAASIANKAMNYALDVLKEGMTELELITELEYVLRKNGHAGYMRMRAYNQEIITGMVASGEAAAVPTYFDGPAGGRGLSPANPQSVSKKKICRHEPILMDIGCCIDGYVTDQTRTVVIGELLDPELLRAYSVAEHILRTAEDQLHPGTVPEHLYIDAMEMAQKAGLQDFFMGYREDQVKFLGHGIGLEIDELPVLAKGFSEPLHAGMVIAIEPKFSFPQKGVVGIENTYLITESGFEKLTLTEEGILSVTLKNE